MEKSINSDKIDVFAFILITVFRSELLVFSFTIESESMVSLKVTNNVFYKMMEKT